MATIGVTRPKINNTVALVHVQLLGDLFIWLPYAKQAANEIANTPGQSVLLIFNASWKEVIESEFPHTPQLGIDHNNFSRSPAYRMAMVRRLRRLGVSMAICMDYPRSGLVHDGIMRALNASKSVGHVAAYTDRSAWEITQSLKIYTLHVNAPENYHRSERHAFILKKAGFCLEFKAYDKPLIDDSLSLPTLYFVVSPGASYLNKAWPLAKFQEIVTRLLTTYPQLSCVLTGAPAEKSTLDFIANKIGPRVINLAGRNSLPQLQSTIANSLCVIANDSAAIHAAALASVESVAIVGGATWGVCLPYSNQSKVFPIPPTLAFKKMDCYGCGGMCIYNVDANTPYPCITHVTVEDVEKIASTKIKMALKNMQQHVFNSY